MKPIMLLNMKFQMLLQLGEQDQTMFLQHLDFILRIMDHQQVRFQLLEKALHHLYIELKVKHGMEQLLQQPLT
jgi:hypothetical protein